MMLSDGHFHNAIGLSVCDGDCWERSNGDVPFCSSLMCCAEFKVMEYCICAGEQNDCL